jgi:hypothetical protein
MIAALGLRGHAMRTLWGYGLLALGLVLAAWRLQTPTPLPVNAPPSEFSATRAFTDIKAIAANAHPLGTVEHDRVRDYLVTRLRAMGLNPQLHTGTGIWERGAGRVYAGPAVNVLGILPGRDRNAPALLIMSHYDSVPNSPGAGDNTSGVAVALEVARAFKARPLPARDVIFLFTDGEECGLLGATLFFTHDPLAHRVGAVVNMDTRGDSGIAEMFETGPRNAQTIGAYARAVKHPTADSLSRVVDKNMPNGTDFTAAFPLGVPGLNFGFIGDEAAYHTPLATPDHLNLGSVQDMGDKVLASAKAFAAGIPAQSADAVYSDVLGLFVIQYPFFVGWILLGLAAVLAAYAIWKAQRKANYAWGRGALGVLLIVILPGLLLWGAGASFGPIDHFQRLHHFDFLLAGSALLAIGGAAFVVALIERKKARPAGLWATSLVLLLVLAAAAQVLVPEGAFILTWPALLAAAVAALRVYLPRGHWAGGIAVLILAVIVVAQIGAYGVLLFTGVGVDLPVVLLAPLVIAMPILLLVPGTRRLPLMAHGAVILAGMALFAFGRFAPPTAATPAPSTVRFVQDQDTGKAYRVATFSPLDSWERAALQGEAHFSALPWTDGGKQWWSPIKPVAVPPSGVAIRRDGKRVTVLLAAGPGAYSAVLAIRSDQPMAHAALDGSAIKSDFGAHIWNEVRIFVPGAATYGVSFDAPPHGKIDVQVLTTYLSWPDGAAPLPPMPANRMAFGTSGGTVTVLRRSLNW